MSSEAQEHLETLGFRHRQLRCVGPTNAESKYYAGRVVGDSPEFARGLDCHGFAHLAQSMGYNIALSSRYPVGDPRRMEMGTPAQVMNTIKKYWEMCEPTSKQIVDDILGFPDMLQKVIDAKGCMVPDLALRTGRRYVHAGGTGQLEHKPRARQRKETLISRPCHPDCIAARDSIRDGIAIVPIDSASTCAEEEEDDNLAEASSGINEEVNEEDSVVQKYEVGALLLNPYGLGCVVLEYYGDGMYDVQFQCDGSVHAIFQDQLRPRHCNRPRKASRPSYSYELV